MNCIVIAIVWTISGVNAPPWYNATHNYTNNSRNSSRLKIAGVKAALGVCIMMNMKEQGLGTCIHCVGPTALY